MGHATSVKRASTVTIANMAKVYKEAMKKDDKTAESVMRSEFIPTFANNKKHLTNDKYECVLAHKQRKIEHRIDTLFPKVKESLIG